MTERDHVRSRRETCVYFRQGRGACLAWCCGAAWADQVVPADRASRVHPGKAASRAGQEKVGKVEDRAGPERKERAVVAGNLAGLEKLVGPAAAGLPVPGPATMPVITIVDRVTGKSLTWLLATLAGTGCAAGSPVPHRSSRKSSRQTRPKTSLKKKRGQDEAFDRGAQAQQEGSVIRSRFSSRHKHPRPRTAMWTRWTGLRSMF